MHQLDGRNIEICYAIISISFLNHRMKHENSCANRIHFGRQLSELEKAMQINHIFFLFFFSSISCLLTKHVM